MATIALYADKVNQMPGLIRDVGKTVLNFKTELAAMKNKVLKINQGVCDMEDVASSIQASSQTQEEKVTSLETFQKDTEQFIEDTARIDNEAADIIRQRKDDFYEQYNYLRPESEKNWIENTLDKVGDWCARHWKEIVIGVVCIVIGAVLVFITGGSFLPALLAGLKAAAIAGMISGGMSTGISLVGSIIRGEDFGTLLKNAFTAFGDGFASGFMFGGMMAGASMAFSSGFKILAKLGVKTGRHGGFGKEGIFKVFSPNKMAPQEYGGGTFFKIGKTFRLDVDMHILTKGKYINPLKIMNFLHMHLPGVTGNIPGLLIVGGHVPVGLYLSGALGAIFRRKDKK